MTLTTKMIAPVGWTGSIVGVSSTSYAIAADRTLTVNNVDVSGFLAAGFGVFQTNVQKASFNSPLPADLVSIVSAATPANGAASIAAQPPHARKLQYRFVIGTTTTTAITALLVTVVGFDQDGNAITEVVNPCATGNLNSSATIKSAYAWASITSITLANYAANGSGTGNTFGVGLSNDFGVPTIAAYGTPVDLACTKATKITKVLGTSNTAADDVASTTTVDSVARTIAPTTAPASNGLVDFEFTYSFGSAS